MARLVSDPVFAALTRPQMIGGAVSSACLTRIHSRKIPLSCFAIALRPRVQ